MNSKGLTLIELLIVLAVLGILSAIAIPTYTGVIKRSARSEAKANLQNLRLLEEQYFAENGEYAPDVDASSTSSTRLRFDADYNSSPLKNPADGKNIIVQLPGFKPGGVLPDGTYELNYYYYIEWTVSGGNTTTFTARAVGRTGTRGEGDSFYINSDNNSNF